MVSPILRNQRHRQSKVSPVAVQQPIACMASWPAQLSSSCRALFLTTHTRPLSQTSPSGCPHVWFSCKSAHFGQKPLFLLRQNFQPLRVPAQTCSAYYRCKSRSTYCLPVCNFIHFIGTESFKVTVIRALRLNCHFLIIIFCLRFYTTLCIGGHWDALLCERKT